MASLVSPGVSVSVIDESVYAPTAVATVPLVFVASAQDKLNPAGSVATGTIAANANKLFLISSQRELASTFGAPQFYKDASGTPLHGYEVNEYGLLTAYSALGVSNRVYVVRADVDLSQLVGTSARPLGAAADGTLWLDLATTDWGIFEWDASTKTFDKIDAPILITSTSDLSSGIPKVSIGTIGQYAIVTTNTNNPVYFKKYNNTWVQVGGSSWATAHPTIRAGNSTIVTANTGDKFVINGTTVTIGAGTVTGMVTAINAATITGVTAYNNAGFLELFATEAARSNGVTADGAITIANGNVGNLLGELVITAGTYYCPKFQITTHVQTPRWKDSDTTPRPSGSVWIKSTSPNNGASFSVKRYNELTAVWNSLGAIFAASDFSANATLDPAGGGGNIAKNSVYVQGDVAGDVTATYRLMERVVAGPTSVTGSNVTPTTIVSNSFTVKMSVAGSTSLSAATTVTLTGTTATTFVQDLLGANITNLQAEVLTTGAVKITHALGGVMVLKNITGTPLTAVGITSSSDFVRAGNDSDLIVSNWQVADYEAKFEEPSTDPVDGTYWYFSEAGDVDVMIHNGTNWVAYKNETNDARGYDLSDTDPAGPQVSASEPTEQSDGTALSFGDLWVDTSDLENYPRLYRWDNVDGTGKWQLVDNADQTTENGILFADARWSTNSTTDVITDAKPTIASLLTSNHLDLDAPDNDLFPRGMLLWNTRRSGFNVKRFVSNYFNATTFPDDVLPTVKDAWVNASGNRNDGSPYMGRHAARVIITSAIAAAIDTNTQIREEQRQYNLIVTPGYPEVADNMVALNNDRKNTAFVIADAPFRLAPTGTDILAWADGSRNDSITTASEYMGVFYPSGITNNPFTTGNAEVLVPSSHMALRIFIRNDDVAFPWFAPAGLRRGLVDNASQVAYIDANGEVVTVGLTDSLRDTLYENKINPITNIPGSGLVAFGQKTRSAIASSLDRINVARLVAYIRERLGQIIKPFLFEPNDKITRDEAKQVVESLMNDLVAKRGIYDYVVVCDDTNNTSDRIDRNELYLDVAIEPVKAVEFVYVPVRIKNTGEIAAG